MAFGGLKGTLAGNAGSITNPAVCSGSVVVAVGDLVVAVCGQQTSLTVTACSDNLGNTYSAQNAGTDGGTPTGRMFYARVTVGGTLTAVNFATTASTNDWAGLAAVIEGPFAVSPLDANPANITSDVSSPFTCPSSGTLARAGEVVIAWGAANQSTVWAATSPNLLAGNANNSTNIKVAIGYQAVASTSAVAPAFTAAANPTQCVLGTASFKRAWEIAADAGSYSLSGQTAALEFDRQVDAATGSYALTGQAATLSKGLTLAAASGAYLLSGQDATFNRNRVVDAAAGSYALTGAAAALEHDRDIVAAAGAYLLSGGDAALELDRQVIAAGGSYALSGAAASLEFDRRVDAASGSYLLAGVASALEFGREIAAEGGSYALSGADADLAITAGLGLDAAAGGYLLSGADAGLEFGFLIEALGGSYLLSGAEAALLTDRLVEAGTGAYALDGADADLMVIAAGGPPLVVDLDPPPPVRATARPRAASRPVEARGPATSYPASRRGGRPPRPRGPGSTARSRH